MTFEQDFDNAVDAANNDVTGQIQAAEAVIGISVEANYLLDVLAGGEAGARDRVTMGVVDKTLEMLGSGIDIRSFIETPMDVDFLVDEAGIEPVRIRGSHTLTEFWDQIFSTTATFRGETRTTVETAVGDLGDWYAIIDEAADPGYEARAAEARNTIAELSPIRDDLRASSEEQQARGLKTYDPESLNTLLDAPEGDRVSVADTELRQMVQQVEARAPQPTASPEAQRRDLRATTTSPTTSPEAQRRDLRATVGPSPTEFRPGMSDAEVRGTAIDRAGAALERRLRDAERADDVAARVRADAIARANAEFERTRPAPREMPGDNAAPVSARRPSEMPGDGAPGRAPRTPRGRGPAPETFSPEAVRRNISATVEETADDVDVDDDVTPPSLPGPGGTPQLTDAQIRDANQAEVELLLAQQFGGFSFFLQKHRSELQVGLTADGQVVAADDPNAATVKNVLDVIVDQGITAPTRVLGLLENTEWWKATDARMREYDVLTADMSEPQKAEYLEPVLDTLRDEAQFLGFQLDPTRARELAEQITRMGEEGDAEYIRGLLTAEEAFNAAEVSSSSFAAARDEIVAMSKRYFTPINEADAAAFAEDIYVGTKTAEGVEQYFKEMAANKFPSMQNALDANITPEQYFAPYKYEIERMLDRPNVDLYEEFGDIIQYIPDTGTGEARPMTLGEVRKYVRGLDEWQQSSQGKDSARALSFSIGKLFGEVA